MTYRAEELDLPYMSNVLTRHDGLEETQKLGKIMVRITVDSKAKVNKITGVDSL